MAASVIQERTGEVTGGAAISLTLAFSSNNTAGNAIHAIGGASATALTPVFTDTNNSYTLGTVDSITDGAANFVFQSAAFNIAGGANSVKVTMGAAPNTFLDIWIKEIGGTASTGPDAHTGAAVVATTAGSIPITLVAAGALISAVGYDANIGEAVSAGAGYTAGSPTGGTVWEDNNGTPCSMSESQHFTSAGSQNITFTLPGAADTWMIIGMSFADSSGGGGSPPIGMIWT